MTAPAPGRRRARHPGVAWVIALGLGPLGCRQLSAPPVPRKPPLPDGGAVFFVGNSFFGWDNRRLPDWVAAVGAASTPSVRIEVGHDIVFGDAPLREFLGHAATREALASGKYDVFVLQAHELEIVDDKEGFHQAVRDFHRAIEAAGGKTVLFMTWDFPWRPFIDEVAASYDEIGRELDIAVIPAGLVYEDCRRDPLPGKSERWLTANPDGDLHPNAAGTAANAYVTFAALTGRDPRGVHFTAPGNDNTPQELDELAAKAWDRAQQRTLPNGGSAAP